MLIAIRCIFFNTRRETHGDRVASHHGHPHALRYTITIDPCFADPDAGWGTARCSVCGSRSNKIFACAEDRCSWDECVDCHNAGRPVQAARAQRAPERHAHALARTVGKPKAYVTLARCDVCRLRDLQVTHHCALCKVDYCEACFSLAYGSVATARHPHALTRVVGRLRKHGVLAKCDACGAGAEVTHYCAPCDVDFCDNCHARNNAPRAAAPPASAPADDGRTALLLSDEPVAYAD